MNFISTWNESIALLSSVRVHLNDQLSYKQNRLHLQKGSQINHGTPIITEPWLISQNLEKLITQTAHEYFDYLKNLANPSHEFYEQLANFKRDCKVLSRCLNHLTLTYQHPIEDLRYYQRYQSLTDLSESLLRKVKDYKSHFPKPILHSRAAKPVNYERMHPSIISTHHSKRIPIEKTVHAAKIALALAQEKPKCTYTALALSTIPSVMKGVVWNPLEYITQGEVTSCSSYYSKLNQNEVCRNYMNCYEKLARQLLYCHWITDEVIRAFQELSPHVKCLDLNLPEYVFVANEMTEFEGLIKNDPREGAIKASEFLEIGNQMRMKKNLINLKSVNYAYMYCNELHLTRGKEKEEAIKISLKLLNSFSKPPHNTTPFISVQALKSLLQIGFDSISCNKVLLSNFFDDITFVQEFLKQNSYQFKNGVWEKTQWCQVAPKKSNDTDEIKIPP